MTINSTGEARDSEARKLQPPTSAKSQIDKGQMMRKKSGSGKLKHDVIGPRKELEVRENKNEF